MGGEPALIGVGHRRGALAGGVRHPSASPRCGWLSCVPCHAAPEAVMRARAMPHDGLGGCMAGAHAKRTRGGCVLQEKKLLRPGHRRRVSSEEGGV